MSILLQKVRKYWPFVKKVLFILVILYVAVSVYLLYENWKNPRVVTVMQKAAESVPATEKNLGVGEKPAQQITEYVALAEAGKKTPVAEFTTTASSVETAASKVASEIKDNDQQRPAAALAKSDKTEVVADQTNQKVDVYKIDLEHKHEVKVGVQAVAGSGYVCVGYQAGKWEGFVMTNGSHQGAGVMYTLAEW